jgi:protein kinase X
MEGVLSKRLTSSVVQRWQKRYFCVEGAKVKYFKDEHKMKLLGAIDLRYATVECQNGKPTTFSLIGDEDGQLDEMRAKSEEEARKWVNELRTQIKIAKEQLHQVENFLEGGDTALPVEEDCSAAASSGQGWLHKRGAAYNKQGVKKYREGKKYKRRFFVLDGSSNLDYFKNETRGKRFGFIDLAQVYHMEQHPPSSDGKLFPFDLVTVERIWSLAAESEKEQQNWFKVFAKNCPQLEAEQTNATILKTIQRQSGEPNTAERLQNFGKSVGRAEFYARQDREREQSAAGQADEVGTKTKPALVTKPSVNLNRQRSGSKAGVAARRQEQTLYEASTSHRGSYGPGKSASDNDSGAGKEAVDDGQSWRKATAFSIESNEKSAETREIVRRALANNILTATLDDADTDKVIDAMWIRRLGSDEQLGVGEGASESGVAAVNFFFVIESGALLLKSASGEEDLGVEDSFGHSTLIGTHTNESNHYNGLHSITALDPTVLWCIDRAAFRKTVAAASANRLTDWVGALRKVPLFESCGLSEVQLNALAEGVRRKTYAPDEVIIRKGEAKAELFFIVEAGRVSCRNITRRTSAALSAASQHELASSQEEPKTQFELELGKGDCFGERALLHEDERACDVVALTEVTCLALSRSTFVGLLGPMKDVLQLNVHIQSVRSLYPWRQLQALKRKQLQARDIQDKKEADAGEEVPDAGGSDSGADGEAHRHESAKGAGVDDYAGEAKEMAAQEDADVRELLQAMVPRAYEEGEVIIEKGGVHKTLFLMSEGKIEMSMQKGAEMVSSTIRANGECFGESLLAPSGEGEECQSDVVAVEKVFCLTIGKKEWRALPLCRRLLGKQAGTVEGALQATAGVVAAAASTGAGAVVGVAVNGAGAAAGAADVVAGATGAAAVGTSGAVSAGAGAVVDAVAGAVAAVVGVAKGGGDTAATSASSSGSSGSGSSSGSSGSSGSSCGCSKNGDAASLLASLLASLDDVEQLHIIGIGSFGTVRLAKSKMAGAECIRYFALKKLAKAFVCQTHQQRNLLNEKNILKKASHPMIIELAATYQDADCLYMLLELVQGGELFRRLHGDGTEEIPLPEDHARFYTANLVLVFEYIHSRDMSVIYRDLKPENLLITTGGFLKVCDWGFAKVVSEQERTYTLCGSPEYLAPETINGVGHGKGVDYWALGGLVYEMLVGTTPFVGDDFGNTAAISESILAHDLQFPDGFPAVAEKLVTSLLEPNPSERLGCLRNGARDIRDHAWFTAGAGAAVLAIGATDWDGILHHTVTAPWLPEVSEDVTDTSNFDVFDEDDPDVVPLIEPYDGNDPAFVSF